MKRKPLKGLDTSTRKGRAIDRLYKAVNNYVTVNGGKVMVVGGIQMHDYLETHTYWIAIKCTGIKPVFSKDEK